MAEEFPSFKETREQYHEIDFKKEEAFEPLTGETKELAKQEKVESKKVQELFYNKLTEQEKEEATSLTEEYLMNLVAKGYYASPADLGKDPAAERLRKEKLEEYAEALLEKRGEASS